MANYCSKNTEYRRVKTTENCRIDFSIPDLSQLASTFNDLTSRNYIILSNKSEILVRGESRHTRGYPNFLLLHSVPMDPDGFNLASRPILEQKEDDGGMTLSQLISPDNLMGFSNITDDYT